MSEQGDSKLKPGRVRASVVAGATLIGIGILLFLVQAAGMVLGVDLSALTWPFFVIVPGVVIAVVALFIPGESGLGIGIFGGILTTVGLILLYQNSMNHWESWAYAWALVAPTSPGVVHLVFGLLRGRRDWVHSGLNLITIGLVIFLVAAAFFELVVGISGFRFAWGGIVWPLLLIVLGTVLLIRSLFFSMRRR